jgi:hypothetical protein
MTRYVSKVVAWYQLVDLIFNLQSLNVVECVEFRRLLLYLRETLGEEDIPGRTKIRESIIKMWREEFETLKKEMKVICP